MAVYQPRGIRNNNPGNIRRSTDRWRGLSPQQQDAQFFQFDSAIYGIRAMAIILLRYQSRYGLRTVRSLINRWAPPRGDSNGAAPGGEYTQDTSSYIRAVCDELDVQADEQLELTNRSKFYTLLCAMIRHENGTQPYGRDVMMQALDMAGVK